MSIHKKILKKQNPSQQINDHLLITYIYLTLYSILRFFLEFIRIDPTPIVFGLRWPQTMSLIIILAATIGLFWLKLRYKNNQTN